MNFIFFIQVIILVGIPNSFAQDGDCEVCTLNQINFIPGDNIGSVTPTLTAPVIGEDGCLRTTVACDVREVPNAITYMTFQDELGGPETPTDLITADLVCTNGSWVYTEAGVSTAITEVSCMFGGVDQNCGTCKPCNIVFTPKRGNGTVGSSWKNYIIDSDGCLTLDVVCPSPSSEEVSFMQFNGNVGGPAPVTDEEIVASLNCVNGTWQFTQNDVSTIVSEVNCLVS